MYPQVVDQLLPYVNAAVAQGVLQQIVRAGTDAELVDALSTLPLGQRGVAEQLTQTLVTTLVTFPNMSEMLVRPLIMIMHSNPDLLLGVDEANKPMAHTYLLLHIVQRGFQVRICKWGWGGGRVLGWIRWCFLGGLLIKNLLLLVDVVCSQPCVGG